MARDQHRLRSDRLVLATLALVVGAVLCFLLLDPDEAELADARSKPRGTSHQPATSEAPMLAASAERAASGDGSARVEAESDPRELHPAQTSGVSTSSVDRARASEIDIALALSFSDTLRRKLEPERALVQLVDSQGAEHFGELEQRGTELLVVGLRRDVYALDATVDGFVHRTESVDLTPKGLDSKVRAIDGRHYRVVERTVLLWSDSLIPVVVRTSGGRPFDELARDLGFDPMHLFVGAFDVVARRAPPTEVDAEGEPALVRFHQPPVYRSWEVMESVVGSLELKEAAPFWIGLRFHGRDVGWQFLERGTTEVEFVLPPESFESSFASLAFRVVTEPGGIAIPDAKVVLRSNTTAHRRGDLTNARSDASGAVLLERVPPGHFEFTVEALDAIHSDQLDLVAGEQRDLGEIVLTPGRSVEVRIVGANGLPAQGWVELGPFRSGVDQHELFPQSLHRFSSHGSYELPLPVEPSILRARGADRERQHPTEQHSATTLLDPTNPPLGVLELVLQDSQPVTIVAGRHTFTRMEVRNAEDIVIGAPKPAAAQRSLILLVPGTYVAILYGEDDIELGRTAFEVGSEPFELTIL